MASNPRPMALRRGEMIGNFRIEECLGQGGFAFTYKAWDTFLNRWVAIKELFRPESVMRRGSAVVPVSNDRGTLWEWRALLRKFTEEAKHLAKFRHPNIVTVINSHEANNTAYIVMQYVEGRTFSEYLSDLGRPIKEAELRRLLDQILDGLEAVHRSQLLHRDIKPSNIYLTRDNQVVLLDFGAARPEGERSGKSTLIFYTDGYSPPEQYTSTEPLCPASDIYATAATLVRAVTRQDPPSVRQRLVTDTYKPLAVRYRGRFSPAFLSAIDAGMALKTSARPQSIAKWRKMFHQASRRPKKKPLDPSLLIFAAFVCLVVAFTAIWVTIRMSSQGQSATAWVPEATSAPGDTSLTAAAPPARPEPEEPRPPAAYPRPATPAADRAPPLVAKAPPSLVRPEAPPARTLPPAMPVPVPPVVVAVAPPTPVAAPPASTPPPPKPSLELPVAARPATGPSMAAPPSRPEPGTERPAGTQVAADPPTPPENLESVLNSFLKGELELPMRQENYAPRLRVNDTGKAGDTRALTVEELWQKEQKDEAHYIPRPGQFTHLGSKLVSQDRGTDAVLMRQVFCFDRVLKEDNKRSLGIVIREVRIERASTTQRRITEKIVTGRASGYRCQLSAADHEDIPVSAATALAKIRAILLRDRENYAQGRHRDAEDLAFQGFLDEAGRAKIMAIEDSKTVLIPGGVDSEKTILTGTPVVDVYVDLEDSAPAVVIVLR